MNLKTVWKMPHHHGEEIQHTFWIQRTEIMGKGLSRFCKVSYFF